MRFMKRQMGRGGKMTFHEFLCGIPAGDYILQHVPYEMQIQKATEKLRNADYVLIGAGAGLSTAAGAQYGGSFFKENFGEFQDKYGSGPYMQDMYSAGFYPYPDEESFWGYWSKQALLAGIEADYTPLHRIILEMMEGKRYFVLSTNADGQFEKAGFPQKQIFCTQGDYAHIQCAAGCHQKIYNGVDMFRQMNQARKDCRIPSYMVPKCPVCGGAMNMNLRCDHHFVEDESWHRAESRFGDFISEMLSDSSNNVVLLELGVGFNTPTIIRYPFEKLVRDNKSVSLIRLNLGEAIVPGSFGDRAVGIDCDLKRSVEDIAAEMLERQDA